jgi:hypothetical protein
MFLILLFSLIYVTFPYDLIKENIQYKIQSYLTKNEIPLKIKIDSIKPYWITGMKIENISLKNIIYEQEEVAFEKVHISISPFLIFFGDLRINIEIIEKNGKINSNVSIDIISLLNKDFILKKSSFYFKNFELKNIFKQILRTVQFSEDSNLVLILPIIEKISFEGELNGKILYQNKKFSEINLKLSKAALNIENEFLNIPYQKLIKAHIVASWNGKEYILRKETQLESQDISFLSNGTLNVDATPYPLLNLRIYIKMKGDLQKNFGFLISQLLNCPSSQKNEMNFKLSGNIHQPVCESFL